MGYFRLWSTIQYILLDSAIKKRLKCFMAEHCVTVSVCYLGPSFFCLSYFVFCIVLRYYFGKQSNAIEKEEERQRKMRARKRMSLIRRMATIRIGQLVSVIMMSVGQTQRDFYTGKCVNISIFSSSGWRTFAHYSKHGHHQRNEPPKCPINTI